MDIPDRNYITSAIDGLRQITKMGNTFRNITEPNFDNLLPWYNLLFERANDKREDENRSIHEPNTPAPRFPR